MHEVNKSIEIMRNIKRSFGYDTKVETNHLLQQVVHGTVSPRPDWKI